MGLGSVFLKRVFDASDHGRGLSSKCYLQSFETEKYRVPSDWACANSKKMCWKFEIW